jgi:hypothetical protein
MKIWTDWSVSIDRPEDEEWPDVGPAYEGRMVKPNQLSLQFRQRPGDSYPELCNVYITGQKRYKNSQRLCDIGRLYIVNLLGHPGMPWVAAYADEALEEIMFRGRAL